MRCCLGRCIMYSSKGCVGCGSDLHSITLESNVKNTPDEENAMIGNLPHDWIYAL